MKIIFDIEANGLKPTEVWCVVCKELSTCHKVVFRNLTNDPTERERFHEYSSQVTQWIGHNVLSYDLPVLYRLVDLPVVPIERCLDTLVLSKLIDYPRDKHSVKDYGIEFGLYKGEWTDYKNFSEEVIEYCERDVDITEKIYFKYKKYLDNPKHHKSIRDEHTFQVLGVNELENNGFALDIPYAEKQLVKVKKELATLDEALLSAFPPRLKLIREINPKGTKYGTINLTSVPKVLRPELHLLSIGSPFCHCEWVDFNPGSPKQVVGVLAEAGWSPVDKTKGHIQAERDVSTLKRQRRRTRKLDVALQDAIMVLERLRLTGWKTNENNLATLPKTAPPAARLLARRILYEARRKTLTEWLGLVNPVTSRVHGHFLGLGAWTHRMAHQKPNMANIPNAVRVSDGKTSLLGKELRSCWVAPKNRLLVGVDAEAIQLRVFAHMINDPILIDAIVNGNKADGTDPHSLNKSYFGSYCKTRNAAKHSLYAMFFGGTSSMLSHIMDCTRPEAQEAIDALVKKYPGLEHLQKEVFPIDARRGYFIGLDGRKVRIPGETVRDREHLCMSGYLQNGEKVVMAGATNKFQPELKHYDSFLVDLVHDEWQNECPNNYEICEAVAKLECQSLVDVGVELELNCPLAGSYFNDAGKPTFGRNWYQTH